MTRKDETAGKAIVNGPRGYRERARESMRATRRKRKGDGEPKRRRKEEEEKKGGKFG